MFFLSVSFHRLTVEIDLTMACCCELNTALGGGSPAPLVCGVGVDIRAGDLFPAAFPDKGPELPLRGARTITGGPNSAQASVSTDHFQYYPLPLRWGSTSVVEARSLVIICFYSPGI